MAELEIKDDVETEEFTDELSDEALDRDGEKYCAVCTQIGCCAPKTDRQR